MLECAHIFLPKALTNAPLAAVNDHIVATGAIFNVPAALIIAAMSTICYIGMRETAGVNTLMVALKVTIIVLFIVAGLSFMDTANWHPYIPAPATDHFVHFGWSGVLQGAATIFFSYLGVITASTTPLRAPNAPRPP